MEWLWLILFGIIGGVLGGMGMGGGTLLIPLLTIFLDISQQNAQGINLIAFLPMSIVAIIIHAKNHLIKFKYALLVASTGVASSLLGAYVAGIVSSQNLSFWFGIFLIALGIFQLSSFWIFSKKNHQAKLCQKKLSKKK